MRFGIDRLVARCLYQIAIDWVLQRFVRIDRLELSGKRAGEQSERRGGSHEGYVKRRARLAGLVMMRPSLRA